MSVVAAHSRRSSQGRSFLPPIHSHSSSTSNTPRRQREAELLKLLDEYDEKEQQIQPKQEATSAVDDDDRARILAQTDTQFVVQVPEPAPVAEVSPVDDDNENVLPQIASHLSSHLSSPYGSFRSQQAIQWLWYVILQGQGQEDEAVAAMLNASDTMPALSEWIDVALRTSKGTVEKRKRNNLIALLAHVTQHTNAQAECAISGLLHALLQHATTDTTAALQQSRTPQPHEEKQQLLSPPAQDAHRWTSSTDAADMELRQLLWCVLASLCSHWQCHAEIRQSQLLSTLLHYVDAASNPRHWLRQRWQPSELLQLQHYALVALTSVAPAMTELFERLDGAERLVCLVANITTDETAQADGRRSAAQRRQLQALAVKCLTEVFAAQYASPAYREVEQLLSDDSSELRPASAASTDSSSPPASSPSIRPSLPLTIATLLSLVADGSLSLSCRSDALDAVVYLCAEHREHRHALIHQRGVELVAAMLADEATLTSHISQCPQFVAAMISCVWRCIVPSKSSTAVYLSSGGVEALLALITHTSSHASLQHQALSCLADLLLHHAAGHARFHGWSCRVHRAALLPATPQSVAPSLAASPTQPPPSLTALELLLTLWPPATTTTGGAEDEAVQALRRAVFSVLDGAGFDAVSEQPGVTPAQRAQLAYIAALPYRTELAVWAELIADMEASGQWSQLVDEDRQRALDIRAALEAQLHATERYCGAMAHEQAAADEAELAAYLAVLNEQRVDLTRRILAAPQLAAHRARPHGHTQPLQQAGGSAATTGRTALARSSKPASGGGGGVVAQLPSGSELLSAMQRGVVGVQHQAHNPHRHNNSLYGRYRQIEVTPTQQPLAADKNATEMAQEQR